MSGQPQGDHYTRERYASLFDALRDADRVVGDLTDVGQGRLLVTRDELDLAVRRAQRLIRSCMLECRDRGLE